MESLAGRVILLWGWRRALAAFVAGALTALAQPPFDFFAVCFVSFPVLVLLLDGIGGSMSRRLLAAFESGWWFGFGYFVAGLWWTGFAVLSQAEAWALPFAVLGLPALLALFYGLAALVARVFWDDGLRRIVALAFGFGLAEWLRTVLLTGFPWNAIGYAAMPVPVLMQSDHVVGLFGMNTLAVFVFAAPALLVSPRHRRTGLALAAALVILDVGYGYARLAGAPAPDRSLPIRVVQPSIDQTQKWDSGKRDRIFKTYLDLSSAPVATGPKTPPEVIIWPETAVPFLLTRHPEALSALAETVRDGELLLTGAVRDEQGRTGEARYYNSVIAVDPSGRIADAVDKVHLVPFGEYVPFAGLFEALGIRELVKSVGPFSAGGQRSLIALPGGVRAAPFICYEIIFPGLVRRDTAGADLIVNLTNDAWFGDTPGPYQHFRQARLRAVETGLPLVRAANNGLSAVVDPYGRIVDGIALDAVGTLDVSVPLARGDRLSAGDPVINGLSIVALFGFICLTMSVVSRLRSN